MPSRKLIAALIALVAVAALGLMLSRDSTSEPAQDRQTTPSRDSSSAVRTTHAGKAPGEHQDQRRAPTNAGLPSPGKIAREIAEHKQRDERVVVATGTPTEQTLTEAQQREYQLISAYFSEQVGPRALPCFKNVGQSGAVIQFQYKFERSKGEPETAWVLSESPDAIDIRDSTLPQEVDDVVRDCMAEATRGTVLRLEADPLDESTEYFAHWAWRLGG